MKTGLYYQVEGIEGTSGVKIQINKYKELEDYLSKYPSSNRLYRQAKTMKTINSTVGKTGAVAAVFFVGFGLVDLARERPYTFGPTGRIIGTSGLVLVIVTGLTHYFVVEKKFIASVKAYNKAASKKTSFLQPLKPDYLTLGNAQGTAGVSIGWHLGR